MSWTQHPTAPLARTTSERQRAVGVPVIICRCEPLGAGVPCGSRPKPVGGPRPCCVSEVVGHSNRSADGKVSSQTLGSSEEVCQHFHGDGFAKHILARSVCAETL